MSKKTITSIILIIMLALLSLWAFNSSSKIMNKFKKANIEKSTVKNEDVNAEELVITETRDGQKYWEIYANSGHYDQAKNKALLNNIKGNFYKNNKVILSFEAPSAIYSQKNKEIVLTGGAKAATNNDIYISAHELKWTGNDQEIFASGNVKIRKAQNILTLSDKSVFTTDLSQLKLIGNSQTKLYEKTR